MPLNRKAQIFTWDLILATVIFLIVLGTILFLWTDTLEDIDSADTEYELSWLATAVSDQLARTPGTPYDWAQSQNISSITVLGLASTKQIGNDTRTLDRVLDLDKVIAFINLTQKTDTKSFDQVKYAQLRNRLFGTGKYDFYVELSCIDPTVLDCFEGLQSDNIVNYNFTCNASNTPFYVLNHTLKSDPDLAAIWRFDEDADNLASDSSGEGNDATINGASWATGKYGSALNFDGNDYVEAIPQTTVTGAFTIALWTKVGDGNPRTIFSTRGPADYGFDMEFRNGNEINASIGNGIAWLAPTANASLIYAHDYWYHIVYAVNQTGYRIFINGTLAKTGTYVGTPILFDVNHTLNIGRKQDGSDYFNGTIDEVKVWRRALSDTEVLDEYVRAEKSCRFGKNVSMVNASYQIYDSKTVTFRKSSEDSLFDDDSVFLEPTANLNVVVYRTE